VYLNQNETTNLIEFGYDNGINFIDTSPIYGQGNSEELIKNAIKNKRSNFVLATKIGLKKIKNQKGNFGVEILPLTKKNIFESAESSLKSLGSDYIDLFQLHTFDEKTPLEVTVEALKELHKEGKIRAAGFGNYEKIEDISSIIKLSKENSLPLASMQIHYNLIERKAERIFFQKLKESKISILTHHSLARGILSGKYKANKSLPKDSRAYSSQRIREWINPDILSNVEKLKSLADTINMNLIEFNIAWLKNKKTVSAILIGARNIEQLKDIIEGTKKKIPENTLLQAENLINKNNFRNFVENMPLKFQEK
jgi:aryl-alcohol dehydrogenase-like predicted oxidoreductase